jgi:hypothetical protein
MDGRRDSRGGTGLQAHTPPEQPTHQDDQGAQAARPLADPSTSEA